MQGAVRFMNAKENGPADERGFTLVEILASLVVLSIVGLTMTAFFTHAMTNAKGNQNKTVMVNLARNTLFYMQKESNFKYVREYFKVGQPLGEGDVRNVIRSEDCSRDSGACANYKDLVKDWQSLVGILNPEINGIYYRVAISYQDDLYDKLNRQDAQSVNDGNSNPIGAASDYLIPVKVEIVESPTSGATASSRKRDSMEVEGYITDEKIR